MGFYDTGCWILRFAVLGLLFLLSSNALNISCGGRLSSSLEVGSGAAPPFIDSHGVLEARFLQPYGYGGIVRDVGPPDPRHSYCGGTPLGLVSTGDSSAYGIAENMVPQDVLAIRHVQVPYGSRTSRKTSPQTLSSSSIAATAFTSNTSNTSVVTTTMHSTSTVLTYSDLHTEIHGPQQCSSGSVGITAAISVSRLCFGRRDIPPYCCKLMQYHTFNWSSIEDERDIGGVGAV